MCNRYALDVPYEVLLQFYQAFAAGHWASDADILPRAMAPGLLRSDDGDRELTAMQFAFCPPGCPTPTNPKRPLNNARVESASRWPWREAFRQTRCVLPLSEFREPCYWGDTAGTEVYFRRTDEQLLHVAGIYRVWTSPDGSESRTTMAFLMRPATPYVMDHGHHRQPLFINEAGIDAWTDPQTMSTAEALAVLCDVAASPDLTFRHARNMADTWKSRQKARLRDRDEQLAAMGSSMLGF